METKITSIIIQLTDAEKEAIKKYKKENIKTDYTPVLSPKINTTIVVNRIKRYVTVSLAHFIEKINNMPVNEQMAFCQKEKDKLGDKIFLLKMTGDNPEMLKDCKRSFKFLKQKIEFLQDKLSTLRKNIDEESKWNPGNKYSNETIKLDTTEHIHDYNPNSIISIKPIQEIELQKNNNPKLSMFACALVVYYAGFNDKRDCKWEEKAKEIGGWVSKTSGRQLYNNWLVANNNYKRLSIPSRFKPNDAKQRLTDFNNALNYLECNHLPGIESIKIDLIQVKENHDLYISQRNKRRII